MAGNELDTDDLVDRVYDVAVAPERLEQLVDSWQQRLNLQNEPGALGLLSGPGVLKHVQRAERILRELMSVVGEQRDGIRDWIDAARAAALVVNRSGVIIAANDAAMQTLWLKPGNTLKVLQVVPDDLDVLVDLVENLGSASSADIRLLRLRKLDENAPILMRIVDSVGGDPDRIGLVTSILTWPAQLSSRLMVTFHLTLTEADVLKALTLGSSVKEIARRTARTEATVRSHVKALLSKTETQSQMELVRITLGLLDVVELAQPIAPLLGPPGIFPEPNHYSTITLVDGRRLDYLAIGDPRGRPFLMLPTDMGFTRLTPPAENWLAANRMRMIVPVRAGYGQSSPLPRRRDAFEVAIEDMFALCDHLRIDICPILAMCDDFHLAVAAAVAAPGRVTVIVALGPTMPATQPEHFRRMPKWTRFVYATARYAPLTLPYMSMAFFQCIRRLGPRRFMEAVMATSKADLAVLADDETLTAMLQGTEISVGPRFTAHVAWAAGAISNYAVDWSEKLAACAVPMVLFAGHQDPFAPFETTKEFAAVNPNITLREFPEYGQLLYPLWQQFLTAVQVELRN